MNVLEEIYHGFSKIRELALLLVDEDDDVEDNVEQMWDDACVIRSLAKRILSLLRGVQAAEVQEPPANSNAEEIFGWIRLYAADVVMARTKNRHEDMAAAAQGMISATRRVEELLEPQVEPEIVNSESAGFTHDTKSSPPAWSQWHMGTMSQGPADLLALDLLERSASGVMEAKRQHLEHSLLELQNHHHGQNHPDIAARLHELGLLSGEAGDLPLAKQHLEESLRMQRSMHGDRNQPEIAVTLHALGRVSRQAGDLPLAKQHLEESLRMQRSMHGDRDHPDIAATLHELGLLSGEAGDLPLAKQHLEESLRMQRSMHGDRNHPEIAVTLHALGQLSRVTGDLPLAKQHSEESLRMKSSLYGNRDHPSIAATLHELGLLSGVAGDLPAAKQHLEESLRMQRSMHGDRDHRDIVPHSMN